MRDGGSGIERSGHESGSGRAQRARVMVGVHVIQCELNLLDPPRALRAPIAIRCSFGVVRRLRGASFTYNQAATKAAIAVSAHGGSDDGMNSVSDEDTTRRLLFGAPAHHAAPPHADAAPHIHGAQPPPPPPPPPPPLAATAPAGSAEEEAEAALRYLEAEWAVRMEAPLSALAGLEDSLSRQIDAASSVLPFSLPAHHST